MNAGCSTSQQCNGGSICANKNCQCPTTSTVSGNACIYIQTVTPPTTEITPKPFPPPPPIAASISFQLPHLVPNLLNFAYPAPPPTLISASIQTPAIPPPFPPPPPSHIVPQPIPQAPIRVAVAATASNPYSGSWSAPLIALPSLSASNVPLFPLPSPSESLYAYYRASLLAPQIPQKSFYAWPGSSCTSGNLCIANSFCYQGRCCCPADHYYSGYTCISTSLFPISSSDISLSASASSQFPGAFLPNLSIMPGSGIGSGYLSAYASANIAARANFGFHANSMVSLPAAPKVSLVPHSAAVVGANAAPLELSGLGTPPGSALFTFGQPSGAFGQQAKPCLTTIVIECAQSPVYDPCCRQNHDSLSYLMANPHAAPFPFPFVSNALKRSKIYLNK